MPDKLSENKYGKEVFYFSYENGKGKRTRRSIVIFKEDEAYLNGQQEIDNELRTFAKTRILKIFSSREEFLSCAYPDPEPSHKTSRHFSFSKNSLLIKAKIDKRPQIVFTGFTAGHRAELEKVADEGGLQVKKDITANLKYLCTGYNAGPKKIEQAERMKALIMNERAFLPFIETGEIPASMNSEK